MHISVGMCLVAEGIYDLRSFPLVAVLTYMPTSSVWEFPLLHTLTNSWYYLFHFSHSGGVLGIHLKVLCHTLPGYLSISLTSLQESILKS